MSENERADAAAVVSGVLEISFIYCLATKTMTTLPLTEPRYWVPIVHRHSKSRQPPQPAVGQETSKTLGKLPSRLLGKRKEECSRFRNPQTDPLGRTWQSQLFISSKGRRRKETIVKWEERFSLVSKVLNPQTKETEVKTTNKNKSRLRCWRALFPLAFV
jgi:hypothetical protein